MSLFEFALERMLLRNLDRHFQGRPSANPPRPSPADVKDACAALLSALAHTGQDGRDDVARAFAQGAARLRNTIGAVSLLPPERCTLDVVDRALGVVALASPQTKRIALDACAACIAADGRVTVDEGELLRAVADSLGCPMPPLLLAAPGGVRAADARNLT